MLTSLVWVADATHAGVSGSLSTPGQSQAHTLHTLHELSQLPAYLRAPHCLAWVDLVAPTAEELTAAADALSLPPETLAPAAETATLLEWDSQTSRPSLAHLGTAYRLDVAAVDVADVVALGSEPTFGADQKAHAHSSSLDALLAPVADTVSPRRLVIVAGSSYVLTVHEVPLAPLSRVQLAWRLNSRAVFDGAGALLHALLDAIVDGYFPIVDGVVRRLERLEPALFALRSASSRDVMQRIFAAKEELLDLRRLVAPQRGIILELMHRPLPLWDARLSDYFRDVHDHTVRITATIDTSQEIVTTTLQSYSSQVSIDLARVVRTLTALTVIFGVPTLISAVYGMNFEFMPEVNTVLGYPFAIALAVASSIGLTLYLRRRRWL